MATRSTAETAEVARKSGEATTSSRPSPAPSNTGVFGWMSRTFESLSDRNFRILWFGMMLSMGGFQMQMIARGILVYDITQDASITAIVSMGFAPSLLVVSLFGGVLGDRMERRSIIQIAQFMNALSAGVVAALIITGTIEWWHLFIVSIAQGAMFAIQMPARQAAIPTLVGKERVGNAVALNAMAMSLMNVAGPALGGLVYGIWGPEVTYVVVTVIMSVAVLITGLIPKMYPPAETVRKSVIGNIKAGFSYLQINPLVRAMLIYSMLLALLSMPFRMLVPVFAEDLYGVDPAGVGVFAMMIGVGGVAASILSAGLRKGQHRGIVFLSAGVIAGVTLLLIGLIPIYVAGVALAIGVGFSETIRWGLGQALIMEETEDTYRARMMSLMMMSFGLMPAAVLPIGYAIEEFGARETVFGMAAVLMVASVLFVALNRRIRQLN